MKPPLETRIDEQETWTFQQCVGLSHEYNVKVRAIIAMVYVHGKNYVDHQGAEVDEERTD